MADEGGGFTGLFKEHPLVMAVSVVAVALIAYLASRRGGSGAGTATIVQPANDPNASTNAAAIAQANIAAGVANISTAGNLIGSESSTAANLRGSLATTEASRQVGLSSLEASLLASEHADDTQVMLGQLASDSQIAAARITAAAQTAANVGTNSAVNNTPVINNNGGTGIPTALQWFGANPPPAQGAGASIFSAAGLNTSGGTANPSDATGAATIPFTGITGADITNAWKRAAAYFGI